MARTLSARKSAAQKPAAPRSAKHTARMGFRLTGHAKVLIERAAQIEGRSVTDFCLAAVSEAARKSIEREQILTLSERDQKAFFRALMHPPKLSPRLKRAFKRERELIASE